LKKADTPETWSLEATDFINKCISRRPESRLGLNNCVELKTHVWLKDFDWKKLANREMKSPFMPDKNPKCPKNRLKPF
jgi:serine/threonine protein kinase